MTSQSRPDTPLATLRPPELIILVYIIALGISPLRDELRIAGVTDLAALRAELAVREGRVAA